MAVPYATHYRCAAFDPAAGTYTGAVLFEDTNSVCVSVQASQDHDNPRLWAVTEEYDAFDSPTAEPPDVQWDDAPYQDHVLQDAAGHLVCNSAKEPYAGGMPRDAGLMTLVVTSHVLTWDPVAVKPFRNSRNQGTFLAAVHPPGFPAGTCRLRSIGATRVRRPQPGGQFYWKRRAVIEVDAETVRLDPDDLAAAEDRKHRWVVADAGYKELGDDGKPRAVLVDGAPAVEPVLLDGAGKRLSLTGTVKPRYNAFDRYPLKDWSGLGLDY